VEHADSTAMGVSIRLDLGRSSQGPPLAGPLGPVSADLGAGRGVESGGLSHSLTGSLSHFATGRSQLTQGTAPCAPAVLVESASPNQTGTSMTNQPISMVGRPGSGGAAGGTADCAAAREARADPRGAGLAVDVDRGEIDDRDGTGAGGTGRGAWFRRRGAAGGGAAAPSLLRGGR